MPPNPILGTRRVTLSNLKYLWYKRIGSHRKKVRTVTSHHNPWCQCHISRNIDRSTMGYKTEQKEKRYSSIGCLRYTLISPMHSLVTTSLPPLSTLLSFYFTVAFYKISLRFPPTSTLAVNYPQSCCPIRTVIAYNSSFSHTPSQIGGF